MLRCTEAAAQRGVRRVTSAEAQSLTADNRNNIAQRSWTTLPVAETSFPCLILMNTSDQQLSGNADHVVPP